MLKIHLRIKIIAIQTLHISPKIAIQTLQKSENMSEKVPFLSENTVKTQKKSHSLIKKIYQNLLFYRQISKIAISTLQNSAFLFFLSHCFHSVFTFFSLPKFLIITILTPKVILFLNILVKYRIYI